MEGTSNSDNVEVMPNNTPTMTESIEEKASTQKINQKVAWNKEEEPSNPEEIWFTPEWKAKWEAIISIQFSGFANCASLHGVVYLGEAGRGWMER